jgi:hypothetical protein
VISATPALAAGSEVCGQVQGPIGPLNVIRDNSAVSCDEAMAVADKFFASALDRTVSFDGWVCGVLGAAQAESAGYTVDCDNDATSGRVLLAGLNQ